MEKMYSYKVWESLRMYGWTDKRISNLKTVTKPEEGDCYLKCTNINTQFQKKNKKKKWHLQKNNNFLVNKHKNMEIYNF